MPNTTSPAIELTNLTKRFGELTAVNAVDLTIAPGEVVALLGPNGAGKTTTTEMILGLTKPDAGSVSIFGQSPHAATTAGRVGAMLQNGALLDEAKVKDVLRLVHGVQAHPLPVAEVIDRADLTDVLNTNTSKLSGGQAQRVRFALAIMADPDVILLDEPTVAFDVDTRRKFWDSMRAFASTGRTVVFATHYLEEADEFADRIVVMRQGSIIADGTGSQIKQQVGGRMLSFVPSQQAVGAGQDWALLPGVAEVSRQGTRVVLRCTNSDAAVRSLLATDAGAHDLEIAAPTLEDAFVELTA